MSFKGLLRNGRVSAAEFVRSLNNLLTGISRCTLDGREGELSTFRESMLALASQVHENSSAAEVETAVTHALELLRDHNDRTLKFNQAHTTEMKAVMRTMTETITYLSESRTRSVHQLQFMERELEQASQIDDIRLLRTRLITCLDVVREETVRLQQEATTRSQEVREEMNKAAKVANVPARFGAMDTVTGLPFRRSAERAITEALQGGDHALAVFVVSRLSAINSKYGRAVGDEVMLRVANHFAQNLSSETYLYRWSGPALVALITVHNNAEEIKRSWTKAAAVKQEVNLESKQRTVFVVVELAMSFRIVAPNANPEDLFRSLDQFVAAQPDAVTEDTNML